MTLERGGKAIHGRLGFGIWDFGGWRNFLVYCANGLHSFPFVSCRRGYFFLSGIGLDCLGKDLIQGYVFVFISIFFLLHWCSLLPGRLLVCFRVMLHREASCLSSSGVNGRMRGGVICFGRLLLQANRVNME